MGLFGGALSLTRSVFAIYLPFLAIALFIQSRRWKKPLFMIVWLCVGWVLPIVGRTVSNWTLYHKFIPLTAQGGQDLLLGTARYVEDRTARTEELKAKTAALGLGNQNWIARDKFLRGEAITYIKAHPVEYAITVAIKFFRFWRPWPYPPYPRAIRIFLGFYYSTIFLFAAAGVWKTRAQAFEFLPVYAFFLCLSLTHAFLDVTLRYRVPLEPFLCFFASAALWALITEKRKN
jgi:hypothetical protein